MGLTREQITANIEAMEEQGANQQEIQEWLNSLKGQATESKPTRPEGGYKSGATADYLQPKNLNKQVSQPESKGVFSRTVPKLLGAVPKFGEFLGNVGVGFYKTAAKRTAELSAAGEKLLLDPMTKVMGGIERQGQTLGEEVAQNPYLETKGIGEKIGGGIERITESVLLSKVTGLPTNMKQAFVQAFGITEGQLTLTDIGQGKNIAQSLIDAVPASMVSGTISALTFGILNKLAGNERAVSKQFNKELQPKTNEMAGQFRRGFDTLGDSMANVTDDAGNSVYMGKSYVEMTKTAQAEIANNSKTIRTAFESLDEVAPITLTRQQVADEVTSYFDDLYSDTLTPAQINTITRELNRMPEGMVRVTALDSRQAVDKLISPKSFKVALEEPQKAFVTEVRLAIRDSLRKLMEDSIPGDDTIVRALNNRIHVGYEVLKHSWVREAINEKAKISSGTSFWSALRNIWDNYIFAPERSTVIPGILKSAAQNTPRVVAPAVTGIENMSKPR